MGRHEWKRNHGLQRISCRFTPIYKGWPMMSIFTRLFPISTDGNGHIEPAELQDSLMEDGAHDCANVAKDIFQEVDSDKDGRISRDEFVAMMKRARTGERLLGITQEGYSIV